MWYGRSTKKRATAVGEQEKNQVEGGRVGQTGLVAVGHQPKQPRKLVGKGPVLLDNIDTDSKGGSTPEKDGREQQNRTTTMETGVIYLKSKQMPACVGYKSLQWWLVSRSNSRSEIALSCLRL